MFVSPEELNRVRKAAKRGSAKAQHLLGRCYIEVDGVEPDVEGVDSEEEGLRWIIKAAEQGLKRSQSYLGYYYEYCKNDMAEALKWNSKAAEQGDELAQYSLGMCYKKGEGAERDMAEAEKWLRKAAKRGHELAQLELDNWI